MKLNKKLTASLLPLALACALPLTVMADDDEKIELESVSVTIASAMDIALEQVPGTVIGAELEHEDDVTVWEVEVMGADNQEVEVLIDAQTGAVLEVEVDD